MQTNNKLREALMHIQDLADTLDLDEPNVIAILDTCRDALAEPVRNGEVGTPEEQNKRLCSNYFSIMRPNHSFTRTALEWAQMPYEEGGANV